MKVRFLNTPFFYVVLGLLVFLTFLAAKLPANFIYSQIANASVPVQLQNIRGSVWSGQVGIVTFEKTKVQNISWQVAFWPLLSGVVDINWQIDDPAIQAQGKLLLTKQQFSLLNSQATLQLSALSALIPQQGFEVFGEISADIDRLVLQQSAISELDGNLILRQVAINERAYVTVGDFNAQLSMQNGRPLATFTDTDSPLDVSGKAKLVAPRQLQYELVVAIEDSTVPGLVGGFNALGRIDDKGQITLRGSQRF